MEELAAMIAQKRKNTESEFKGRKYVKRAELEEARLRKLREEEVAERSKRGEQAAQGDAVAPEKRRKLDGGNAASGTETVEELPREEIVRRLRALQQPVTLFGEDDEARRARLKEASSSLKLTDEQKGMGQQNNELLVLQRAEKAEKARRAAAAAAEQKAQAEKEAEKQRAQPEASTSGRETEADDEQSEMMAAFKAAAEAVKAQREEAAMCTEDRISKHLQSWCAAWEQDMERRPADVKESGPGVQATFLFKQTMQFFKPMWRELQKRRIPADMLAGLWMIVDAIQNRNYLYAYDIYMRLAIGNAPWPIGVTSVGIHERSSREKISHATGMNVGGSAHIMNDEATRKYLQAIKRLLTFMQRAFPTDPSRSVDFDGFKDAARGAAGAGSDKLALLEAESSGTTWRDQGLAQAPHFLDTDGSVRVPQSWRDMVIHTTNKLREHPGSGTPPLGRSSPSLGRNSPTLGSPGRATPPLSPSKPVDKNLEAAKQRQHRGSPLRGS